MAKGDVISAFGSLPEPPKAPREANLVADLDRELQANGWRTWREVHFIAPLLMTAGYTDATRRRIDLYARRTEAGTEHNALGVGFCLGIEAKYQPTGADLRCMEQQVVSALCGHDWHTDAGPLRRPDVVVCATEWTLTAGSLTETSTDDLAGQRAHAEMQALDRRLWASGGAVLWRYAYGVLGFRMHVKRQDVGRYVTSRRTR